LTEITLLWHDYETWGVNPRRDRPAQFAAIRTDLNLDIIEDPIEIFCQPSPDFIPHPEAVLVTAITPQRAMAEGIPEAEFFQQINTAFSKAGTCGVGYNSIRFDDEVTRFGFYRNFIDPYAREWQNGNSRWDILDLVRMTYALRPEGIEWPLREDGTKLPSFRLEQLTTANGIEHAGAHDALIDVKATIEIARLIKKNQPRLFDFYFSLRQKAKVATLLKVHSPTIILHVSGMFPAELGCIAPIYPLMQHPTNKNEIICFDLRQDPELLLSLNAKEIALNLYTPNKDRTEDDIRVALKGIHLNKSPALAPIKTLSTEQALKWKINWQQITLHKQKLLADNTLLPRLQEMYQTKPDFGETDVDFALYNGFINPADRKICNKIINTSAETLAGFTPAFSDNRLATLFSRYRARNWPEILNADELREWQEFCHARLMDGEYGSTLTASEFNYLLGEIAQRELSPSQKKLMQALVAWVQGF
jgi:exodeoxyribonuclease-1